MYIPTTNQHTHNVLTSIACERIMTRLGEAIELAIDDLPGNLQRLRQVLNDVVYRVDAIQLVNSLDRSVAERAA